MSAELLLAASSFVLCFLLTPLLRNLAIRKGWLDKPDHVRKTHKIAVPRIGGVPIVLAYVGAFAILLLFGVGGARFGGIPSLVWGLLPAALLVFITGLVDDIVGLKPWQKLSGLIMAAGLACLGGIHISTLAGHPVGVWAVPLTILWLVACANAFNLIDGVDGVAAGVGLFATLTVWAAALLRGDTGLMIATAPLAGALCGFLCFNFNPASIFLGDSGSLWVGFMLGCFSVVWWQKSVTLIGITAPMIALSIPLLDTALSIGRRFLRGYPIFGSDRGHIHHRLLDRGLTPRRVALLIYAASGVAACFSLLQSATSTGIAGLLILAFCGGSLAAVHYLGYREFGIAARLLKKDGIRSIIKSEISLQRYEEHIRAASSIEDCWRAIRTASHEFGFSRVTLRLGERVFEECFAPVVAASWILRIPLSDSEYLEMRQGADSSMSPMSVAPLAGLLARVLTAKAIEFEREELPEKLKTMSATAGPTM